MIFGKHKVAEINLLDLTVLPQVRKVKNNKLVDLVESIKTLGLINPIDIAEMKQSQFQEYLDFINGLWKKDLKINDFPTVDNNYYIVIAGHSRLEAIKQIAKELNESCSIYAKVHEVKTSEELLAIQLDENIHSAPRIEERAIAIIENYKLGIIKGHWSNKEEFLKINKNKFNRRVLNEALSFAELPLEVQEFIFQEKIPYAVGVSLGQIQNLIMLYEKEHADNPRELDYNIKLHFANLLGKLRKAKSVKRGNEIISNHAKNLLDHFKPKEELQQELFAFIMDSPERQAQMHKDALIKEHTKITRDLKRLPFEYIDEYLALDTALSGVSHESDIKEVNTLYNNYIKKLIKR